MAKTVKRKKSVKSLKYTGELATPLIELSTLIAFFGGDAQAAQRYYDSLWDAKLEALFERYSIDPAAPDVWKQLAISLAREHVPGMDAGPAPKKPGRPRSWEDGLNVKLLRAVEDLRDKNKGMTIAEAVKSLRKDGEWEKYTQENLEVRQREASRIENDYRRLYREWKENPNGLHVALLKAFAVDLDEYFEQRRLEGFKIDEI